MKRRILSAIALLGTGLVIIVGVALLNLQSLVDSLKPRLEAEASARLGRPLRIESLRVGLASEVRLIASGIRVSSPDTTGVAANGGSEEEGELPRIQQVEMAVRLLPLLIKEVEVTSLTLTKPEVTIEKTVAGTTIKGLFAADSRIMPHAQAEETQTDLHGSVTKTKSLVAATADNYSAPTSAPIVVGLPLLIAIKELKIEDGRINYRDPSQNLEVDASEVKLKSAVAMADNGLKFSQTRLEALVKLTKNAFSPTTTKVAVQVGETKLVSDPLKIDFRGLRFTAFGLTVAGDLAINPNTLTANLTQIDSKLAEIESLTPLLNSNLHLTSLEGEISGRGEIVIALAKPTLGKIERAHGSFNFSEIGAESPFGTGPRLAVTHLNAPVQYAITDGKGDIKIGSLTLQTSSFITQGITNSSRPITADISIAEANLNLQGPSPSKTVLSMLAQARNIKINSDLGTVTAPYAKYDSGSGMLELRANSEGLDMVQIGEVFTTPPIDLRQYNLQGELGFNLLVKAINLSTRTLGAADAPLNIGPVNFQLDGHIIPKQLGSTLKGHKIKNIGGSPIKISSDVDSLQAQIEQLSVDLNGESLRVSGNVHLRDRLLALDPLNLAAFGGESKISLTYDLRNGKTAARVAGDSLILARILKGANIAKDSQIAGTLRSLTSNCQLSAAEPLTTLSGPLTFTVEKTSLKGFNLIRELLVKIGELPLVNSSLLNRLPDSLATAIKENQTTIETASLASDIKAGLVQIKHLDLTSQLFSLKGNGTYLLSSGEVNLKTSITLAPTLSAELIDKVKELSALRSADGALIIPVRISGTPPNLVPIPDVAEILRGTSGEVVREKAAKAIDKLLRKGGLEKLLGN